MPVEQWLKDATTNSFVSVLPITCDISRLAGTLPEHHKYPADRIIIATALCHNLKLMSLDSIFPAYQEIAERLIVK